MAVNEEDEDGLAYSNLAATYGKMVDHGSLTSEQSEILLRRYILLSRSARRYHRIAVIAGIISLVAFAISIAAALQ